MVINTCYNPIIKFNDDFGYLLHCNRKLISFKNYETLANCETNIKELVASGCVENLYKCRHCEECLKNKKYDWFLRCQNEKLNGWKNIYFITLTFDNDHYAEHTKSRFLSIWLRNSLRRFIGKENFVYFAVSEFGEKTGRFHFHLLLYTNYFFDDLNPLHKSKKGHLMQYHSDFLDAYWKYGLHTISKVQTDAALKYCIKYTSKNQNLKIYCSRGFGNFIHDVDNCNLLTLPNSIFINANARNYNAYKSFLRHEISKGDLWAVFKENEPYMRLKDAKKHMLTFTRIKNKDVIAYKTLLNDFTTNNMHKTNCKNVL